MFEVPSGDAGVKMYFLVVLRGPYDAGIKSRSQHAKHVINQMNALSLSKMKHLFLCFY